MAGIHEGVEGVREVGEDGSKDYSSEVSDAETEAWAKIFKEATVVLILMFGFVEVPEDWDGLIYKI